jgi:molecular chaperone DnaK (HSP70)
MAQPQSQKKKEDKVIFSTEYTFKIVEKDHYNEALEEWVTLLEADINGQKMLLNDNNFEEILQSLKKKLDVLKYVYDDTYEKIREDIMADIAKLIYKLEYKHRY